MLVLSKFLLLIRTCTCCLTFSLDHNFVFYLQHVKERSDHRSDVARINVSSNEYILLNFVDIILTFFSPLYELEPRKSFQNHLKSYNLIFYFFIIFVGLLFNPIL
jgi:hypothetical protein